MKRRANVFAIHPYTDAPRARRLESLLREADPALAHYTVLPERALPGSRAEVLQGIDNRLRFSTAVVVVNAPGLHVRETSTYEMIRAVEMDKRIVVVQPHQDFHLPVPAVLDGHVYRHVGWRVDAVGRAIRGEYPLDTRLFDIAEVADRRRLVGALAAGAALMSFVFVGCSIGAFRRLQQELAAHGVQLTWGTKDTRVVANHALVFGTIFGGMAWFLSGDPKSGVLGALGGAAVGTAVGMYKVEKRYSAQLVTSGTTRMIKVEAP